MLNKIGGHGMNIHKKSYEHSPFQSGHRGIITKSQTIFNNFTEKIAKLVNLSAREKLLEYKLRKSF